MSWTPNPKEIVALSKSPPNARYKYFLNHACDSNQIVGIWNGGWSSFGDPSDKEILPIWPHAEYTKPFLVGSWANRTAKVIALDEFLSDMIPGMIESNSEFAVFPVLDEPTGAIRSITITAIDLKQHLENELSQY